MKTLKCDVCGIEKPFREVKKYNKHQLRHNKVFMGIEFNKSWKKRSFKKIEKNNVGFKRRCQICKGCYDE